MPGGNTSIPNNSLLDLQGFLARKRISPERWLTANNITSVEALGRLIRGSKWFVAPELRSVLERAVISLPGPVASMPESEPVEEPPVPEEVAEEEAPLPRKHNSKGKGKAAGN